MAKRVVDKSGVSSSDSYPERKKDAYSLALDDKLSGARDYGNLGERANYFGNLVNRYGNFHEGSFDDSVRTRMHRGKAYIAKAVRDNKIAEEKGLGYDATSTEEAVRQTEGNWGKYGVSIRNAWIDAVKKNPRVGKDVAYILAENGYVDDAVKVFSNAFGLVNRGNYKINDGTLDRQVLGDYHVGLAQIFKKAGRFGSAKEHLKKALEFLGEDSSRKFYQDSRDGENKGYHARGSGTLAGEIWGNQDLGGNINTNLNRTISEGYYNSRGEKSSEGLNSYFVRDKQIQEGSTLPEKSSRKSSKKFATLAILGLGGATFALVGSQMTGNVIGYSNNLLSAWGIGSIILSFIGVVSLGLYIKNSKKSK